MTNLNIDNTILSAIKSAAGSCSTTFLINRLKGMAPRDINSGIQRLIGLQKLVENPELPNTYGLPKWYGPTPQPEKTV